MQIKKNISLKDFTNYKIGGPAEYFFIAESEKDFLDAINWAKEKSVYWRVLGGGTNVIVADKGLKGLTIVNQLNSLELELGKKLVRVGSGMKNYDFIRVLIEKGKGGLEFLANIPGTIGGAVAGNAGCYGKFIADYLVGAKVLVNGEIKSVGKDFFDFEYRDSKIKKGLPAIILEATFKVEDIDEKESQKIIDEDKTLREKKHPIEPSCGSFFRNPSRELTAAKLIEDVGLKGYKLGGAMVSEKHSNFIINTGKATAKDIKELASFIKKEVKEKKGVELKEEVQYLN